MGDIKARKSFPGNRNSASYLNGQVTKIEAVHGEASRVRKKMGLAKSLGLPKEHGAWAMLYVPLVVGVLVAGAFSFGVVALTLSVSFLFIARESYLAWWRARSRGQAQPGARRKMLIYLGLAALFGAPLVLISKLFLLAPFGLATLALLIFNARQAVRREDRTISGEIMAIVGLTLAAPAAYYTASGRFDATALWLWALCALYFASSVFYVKLRVYSIARRRESERRRSQRTCALYHAFLLAGLMTLFFQGSFNLSILVAFFPVLARSFWQMANPAEKLNLQRVGVLELVYSLVFLIFITLTFRLT
jgi:YwiC-like protein